MLEQLTGFIIQLIQTSGYIGVFVLMTLESALIPIPSEITMPFAGFLSAQGKLNFYFVVLAGTIGNLAGSLIAYYIGYFLEENLIIQYIRKYGKIILITEDDFEKANKWFKKYGDGVVFFSRLLPAVRTFISLPAGIFEMNILKFSTYTFIGSLIWSFLLTYVGIYFQSKWTLIESYFRKFDYLILIIILFTIFFYINHKLKIFNFKKVKKTS